MTENENEMTDWDTIASIHKTNRQMRGNRAVQFSSDLPKQADPLRLGS